MDRRRLAAFALIFDEGSISKAARKLGIAQPALSQQLALLEHDLGARLFERSAAGVTPTAAGAALYARAQVVLRLIDDLKHSVSGDKDTIHGEALIGLPPTLALRLGAPLLKKIREEAPHILLRLVEHGETTLVDQLNAGRIDIAALSRQPRNPDIVSDPLFVDTLWVAASRKAPALQGLDLEALAALPWVTTSPANGVRRIVEATLARVGATPNIVAEVDSLAVVLAAVADGIGITVLPASALPTGRAFQFTRFADAKRPLFLCRRATTTQAAAFVCSAAKIICDEIAAAQHGR